ncbi:MAG: AsmA family protein [Gammaproteobacteria bacterium]
MGHIMVKTLKYGFYTLLGLIILIAIALFLMTTVIDANRFKQPLQSSMSMMIGRDVQIQGNIDWRIYPWLGLSAQKVAIANPQAFDEKTFATVESADLNIRLVPLIRGNIQVANITLEKPMIKLIINAQGNNNWDDFGKENQRPIEDQAISQESTAESTDSETESGYFDLGSIKIAEINLKQAQLILDNQQTQQTVQLEDFNLFSKNIAFNQLIPLDLSFAFQATENNRTILAGTLTFGGELGIDEEIAQNQGSILDDIKLVGDIEIKPLAFEKLSIDNLSTKIDIEDNMIILEPMQIDLYQGQANGSLIINLSKEVPFYALSENIQNIQAGPLFADTTGTAHIDGTANATLELSARGKDTKTIMDSLNGNIKFKFSEGELLGVDVPYLINWASAVLNQDTMPKQEADGKGTAFGILMGTADIEDGMINNTELNLTSSYYQINGEGTVNLRDKAVDYKLQAEILNLDDDNPFQKIQQALGGNIPFVINGDIEQLRVQPDFPMIIQARAGSEIRVQVKELFDEDKLKEVSEKAKEILNRFTQ